VKVKQAFLHGPEDLRIEEVELPELESDQILVELKACGICGSDIECFEGKSDEGRYDLGPYTPGHEWSGKVVEMGDKVTTFNKGDKVTGDCVLQCNVCRNCKDGLMPSACENMREAGFRPDSPGGMGEYLIMKEQYLHKLPDSWTYEEGAIVETFSVAYYGIWGNDGYIDASETAVIFGAGPIGQSAVVVAKTSGAEVIVVEPLEKRRNLALELGADKVVNPSDVDDIAEKIMDLTDGRGANLVVECSGTDKAVADCFDVAGHSARVRLVGHTVGHKVPAELGLTIWKTLEITGSGGIKDFMPRTIRFMESIKDEVDFNKMISDFYPFEDIHKAFDKAMNDQANAYKVMLKINQD
jgi:threonine dehydrogenase-like Zn-dependent dehydrogenase